MIVWSVRDGGGRCRADGCAGNAVEAWRAAGDAAVEMAAEALPVEVLVLDVGGQRARAYVGTGSAGADPISFGAVVDDLVRAVSDGSATTDASPTVWPSATAGAADAGA